jgi:hypothetical protein
MIPEQVRIADICLQHVHGLVARHIPAPQPAALVRKPARRETPSTDYK